MSLTEPPPQDENQAEVRPSRRFKILFGLAMVAIAVGYMWVWQAKTSRVVAERPPDLVLGQVASRLPGHGPADAAAIRDTIAAHLRSVPRLVLLDRMPSEVLPDPRRPARPAPGQAPTRSPRPGQSPQETDPPTTREAVARRAGAPPRRVYALAGTLDRDAGGGYVLELTRTDARTDSAQYIYRVRGPSLPEVAHRMAVQVAMSFGLALPRPGPDPAWSSDSGRSDTAR
ncbi:MAG TPA: hypothetical protein VK912_07855 [Longimicrobiales bacterium]|nr:hypothetical protein [Longimicrobiales bacterium]